MRELNKIAAPSQTRALTWREAENPARLRALWPEAVWMSALFLILVLFTAQLAQAQSGRALIDVELYNIDADINLATQVLDAQAQIRFTPREETETVIFELHNGLNVSRVVAEDGSEISAIRYAQDFTIRLSFPQTLPVGTPVNLTFFYNGSLVGVENSPIENVSLASIEADRAFLLYPARWFPVNGYAADRFAANISVTVEPNLNVIGSGLSISEPLDGKVKHTFEFSQPSFPGSIAVLPEDPVRVESEGVTTDMYFKTADAEQTTAYGEEIGSMVRFYSERFAPPYSTSLAVVEVGEYSPVGYAAPGIIFMSPYGITPEVNRESLGTQVAHQWWPVLTSPGNRNHTWLDRGLSLYSAMLYIEDADGEEGFDPAIQDVRIGALTYDDIPIIQSGRLDDFSFEISALAGYKGAMVMHMLRWAIGDEAFFDTMKQFIDKFMWRSMTTDDLRETAEQVSGKSLEPFFIQWTESKGTPEFNQEYTIYRLGDGEGFRVLGKIKQDMDTFSMPVELKIETEGEPEFQVIEVVGTSSDYTIDTFGKPRRVILDPNNRILRFDEGIHVQVEIRKGEQLVELGYYNDALSNYQKALEINRFSSLSHYRIGEVFLLQNNYQSAANEFRECLNGDQEPSWTEVWAHINLAKIFDITGQRERAVNEYQLAIRSRDNTQGAQDEARKYLENPYRRERKQERIY